MYRPIDVWKRIASDTLIRYRCFEIIGEQRFCVQGADFVRVPPDRKQMEAQEKIWMELLVEVAPDERADTFPTLEKAIAEHNGEFVEERQG